jgi:hypothetical protein
VRAPVGQHVHLAALPVHQQGQVTELAAHQAAVGQLIELAQVVPAQSGQVADLLGVTGARAQPQGQVAAQVGSGGGQYQPAGGQHPAVPGPPAGPGGQ